MNISIYLPKQLEAQLSLIARERHLSKNSIVRQALEEWIIQHSPHSSWPPHFFDFEPIKETPDFSSYRQELTPPKENIF